LAAGKGKGGGEKEKGNKGMAGAEKEDGRGI